MGTDRSFDVVILGSGSAAFAAAIKATELGARVALTEAGTVGGTCVNVGCIPSKTLIRAAELSYASAHTAYRGLRVPQGRVDFAALVRQKDRLVRRLRQHKYLEVAEGNDKITLLKGRAPIGLAERRAHRRSGREGPSDAHRHGIAAVHPEDSRT